MKLYNNNFSPNAKRPRVCAAECGVTLDLVQVDFAKGEHKATDYVSQKNPMGKVPALEDGDYILWESPAMLYYIAGQNPGKGLLPTGARDLAEIARWICWNASHLEAGIFRVAFERMVKPMMGGTTDESVVKSGEADVARFAPVLDAHLAGKSWLLGNAFTIADIALATSIDFGRTAGFDYAQYKNMAAWLGRVSERPSWSK